MRRVLLLIGLASTVLVTHLLSQSGAAIKAESFDDLVKALPQDEEALNRYKGDLGKLLSRIMAKSPKWNHKGTVTDESRRVDTTETEHLPPHMVVTRNTIKISSTTITAVTSPRTLDVWTYREVSVYWVEPKLIKKVVVLGNIEYTSPNDAPQSKRTVYAIRLIANDERIAANTDRTTITYFGGNLEWDARDRSWPYPVPSFDIEIACNQEAAVAIGRAVKKLLEQKGGTVSFEDASDRPQTLNSDVKPVHTPGKDHI